MQKAKKNHRDAVKVGTKKEAGRELQRKLEAAPPGEEYFS